MSESFDINKFKMRAGEDLPVDTDAETEAYDSNGSLVDANSPKAVAKTSLHVTGTRHSYVRVISSGFRSGSFYDPRTDELGGINKATGRDRAEFREVSEESYQFYVKFLKGGNGANLRNAERSK